MKVATKVTFARLQVVVVVGGACRCLDLRVSGSAQEHMDCMMPAESPSSAAVP